LIEAEQGYLIVAAQSDKTDYVTCARVLAKSIKVHEPVALVCIVTDAIVDDPIFDFVKPFPYGVNADNPFAVEWQLFWASPFRRTIKLESDMIVPRNISHWWHWTHERDVVVSSGCLDFRGNEATSRTYRRLFDDNNLPDLYNAITYWRMSKESMEFFKMMSRVFSSWSDIKTTLKFADQDSGTTDAVYAVTAQILGPEKFWIPGSYPKMVHMKPRINNTAREDWTKELTWELTDKEFRINTITQTHPVHYHIKEFAKELEPLYDSILGSRSKST